MVDACVLDQAIAIGDEAAKRAIDRAICIRRIRSSIRYALVLMRSGRVEEARHILEVQLANMKVEDEI